MASQARVLVVDDSPTILKVVSAILARAGYEPFIARDGLAGIELIKKGPKFDLVLLDFVMPRMNGYAFCRELRSNPAHRSLPVVLMSAKGDKIRGQFVQQTGAVDAITKPFDARALVAVVQGALAKTAEGRARPLPEGPMPDEDTIAESIRPSVMPKHLKQRAGIELAHQIATAITPVIMNLPPEARGSEAAVMQAIAAAMTPEVVGALSVALRDVDPGNQDVKEVLSGDMSAVPLAEVLQVLQMQRQTGVLRVFNNKMTLTIWVRQGLVDHVQSRGTADEFRLGRYFIERGLITREQLDQLLRDRKPGAPVGQAIVDAGLAAKEDLVDALARQSSELIYEMLRWPFGRFTFTREPFRQEAESAKLGLGISGLVLEGFRRVDEWRLMEGTINFDSVVMVDQVVVDGLGSGTLTRTEQMVLSAVDGARTVSEIIKECPVSSFDAVKAIYQFLQSRVLRPRAA